MNKIWEIVDLNSQNKNISNTSAESKCSNATESNCSNNLWADPSIKKEEVSSKTVNNVSSTEENDLSVISKNSMFDIFYDLKNSYTDFLSELSTDQLAALSNITGFVIIFIAMTSLCSILISHELFKFFKIEERLSKFFPLSLADPGHQPLPLE